MSSEESCRHKAEQTQKKGFTCHRSWAAQVFKAQKAPAGQTHYVGEGDLELLTPYNNRQGTPCLVLSLRDSAEILTFKQC